jgi:type III polyketide synthase
LKRNMNHVRRTLVTTGDVTPPESDGNRSDGEVEDLAAEVKDLKAQGEVLGEKLSEVHPVVPEQNDSLSEALNGVELD